MSLPLSAGMALVGGTWLVYGMLVGDLFIEVRLTVLNILSFILSYHHSVCCRFLIFVALFWASYNYHSLSCTEQQIVVVCLCRPFVCS